MTRDIYIQPEDGISADMTSFEKTNFRGPGSETFGKSEREKGESHTGTVGPERRST